MRKSPETKIIACQMRAEAMPWHHAATCAAMRGKDLLGSACPHHTRLFIEQTQERPVRLPHLIGCFDALLILLGLVEFNQLPEERSLLTREHLAIWDRRHADCDSCSALQSLKACVMLSSACCCGQGV